MSWVTNVILTTDLTDEARGEELSRWLREQAPTRHGAGRGVGALARTTSWGGWKHHECTVFTGVLHVADVEAVVRHVERGPWAYPEFLQLLIQDQEDVFFRLCMFRAGRLVELTPPHPQVEEEVWPRALNDLQYVYLRTALPDDAEFLTDMLVEAVNWPEDRALPRRQILDDPRNAHYVADWKQDTDIGVVAVGGPTPGTWPTAEDDPGAPVGAAWLRYLPADDPGYGYGDAGTPELAMGVCGPWRRRGIGRALLRRLLADAAGRGITRVSLSVGPGNAAQRLYASEGFAVVGTDAGGSLTMLWELP
ncbi:GNAT family N-acetyltransferase [Actinospica durhamensis]|uniref:GNAT family N-acetyltransferase n=1 Tax=Actinospica durhamensis TaxID=1508375 RepID=A0A941EMX8_9ACTN|nr:GNAT family N-acetyltransferase [Actinospica durhamensis]MBR7833873.1 GNAT family N-acetyltransferase [Actinospica durhamensis]